MTVGYNALEGIVAIAAGHRGDERGAVVVAAAGRTRIRALGVERRAARGAGLRLLALGVYIVTHSVRLLLTGNRPESSLVSPVVTSPPSLRHVQSLKAIGSPSSRGRRGIILRDIPS